MGQGTQNRRFIGSALICTPSRADDCDVTPPQAYARDGQVTAVLRNAGTSSVEFTRSGELSGGHQTGLGSITLRLPRGQDVHAALLRMPAAAGAESLLRLRAAACTLLPG